ncbi:hypothetical protein [Streptomyces sp. NPDC094468]|uniref:hypothetical protein n=1 Tax=Streptomyces sp. NPDC094468 TaxID=3366066 RepID=UPI003830B487
MAWAVGVDSDRLTTTGRDDAAAILRELERSKSAPAAPAEAAPLVDLEEWQQRVILGALDERPRSGREKAALLRKLAADIESGTPENGSTTPFDNGADQGAS